MSPQNIHNEPLLCLHLAFTQHPKSQMLSKIKTENSSEPLFYFFLKFRHQKICMKSTNSKNVPFSAMTSLIMKMDTVGIYYGAFGMPAKLLKWTIYTKNLQR